MRIFSIRTGVSTQQKSEDTHQLKTQQTTHYTKNFMHEIKNLASSSIKSCISLYALSTLIDQTRAQMFDTEFTQFEPYELNPNIYLYEAIKLTTTIIKICFVAGFLYALERLAYEHYRDEMEDHESIRNNEFTQVIID